jgi:hypothetical protein
MAGDENGRPQESQEEADYRDGPPQKPNRTLWLVLGVLSMGLVGLLVILAFSWLLLASPAPPPVPAPAPVAQTGPAQGTRRMWSREELKTAVLGKTENEVTWVLGPPVEVSTSDSGEPIWVYRRITHDTSTGTGDQFVYIDWKDGKVVKVRF